MTYAAIAAGVNKYYPRPVVINSSSNGTGFNQTVTSYSKSISSGYAGKLAIYSFMKSGTTVLTTNPTSAGWTLVYNGGNRLYVWYKLLTSMDISVSVAWTTAGTYSSVFTVYDGVSKINPFDITTTTFTGTGATVTLPAITAMSTNCTIIRVASKYYINSSNYSLSTPISHTLIGNPYSFNQTGIPANNTAINVSSLNATTFGTYSSATSTSISVGSAIYGVTMALRPGS